MSPTAYQEFNACSAGNTQRFRLNKILRQPTNMPMAEVAGRA
jgi:hypothetical protein